MSIQMLMNNFRRKKIIETLKNGELCYEEKREVLNPYGEFIQCQINKGDKGEQELVVDDEQEEEFTKPLPEKAVRAYDSSEQATAREESETMKSEREDDQDTAGARDFINGRDYEDMQLPTTSP